MDSRNYDNTGKLKVLVLCLLYSIGLASIAGPVYAGDVDKAKEYISAQMYKQAVILLKKAIDNKPTNAQAHYLLGKVYLLTEKYGEANVEFERAIVLKSSYADSVARTHKEVGDSALKKNNLPLAKNIYGEAISYDPSLKSKIATALFKEGDIKLKSGGGSFADDLLSTAVSFDISLKDSVCDSYHAAGANITNEDFLSLSNKTSQYCAKYNAEMAAKLIFIADSTKNNIPSAAVELTASAARLDPSLKSRCVALLLEMAREAYGKSSLNVFKNAYETAKKIDAGIIESNADSDRCLNALYLYETGMRARAISLLSELKTSKDAFAMNTAIKLLSPPAIGVYPVNLSTEIDRNKLITLIKAEIIDANTIRCYFSLKNLDNTEDRYYLYETNDSRGNMLRIIDSNGKEFLSKQKAFVGGNHAKNDFYEEHIILKPLEEALVYIDFPMISEGSHGFTLKSADNYMGWQNAYWFRFEFPK